MKLSLLLQSMLQQLAASEFFAYEGSSGVHWVQLELFELVESPLGVTNDFAGILKYKIELFSVFYSFHLEFAN